MTKVVNDYCISPYPGEQTLFIPLSGMVVGLVQSRDFSQPRIVALCEMDDYVTLKRKFRVVVSYSQINFDEQEFEYVGSFFDASSTLLHVFEVK